MNQYYHLPDTNINHRWDYANFIFLYHDIYKAIKEVNSDIKVGPGLSWSVLMSQTVPSIKDEFTVMREEGTMSEEWINSSNLNEAQQELFFFEIAAKRTIWPLLVNNEGQVKADFIGLNMTPNPNQEPFNGNSNPTDEDYNRVRQYYRLVSTLLRVSHGDQEHQIPLVLPQIDWESPN
jgi:hypothetical protein